MELGDRKSNPDSLIRRQSLCRCSARRASAPSPARSVAPASQTTARPPAGAATTGAGVASATRSSPRSALRRHCGRSWPRHRSHPRRPHRAPASRHPRPQEPAIAVPAAPRCPDSQRAAVKGITPSKSWQVAFGNRRGCPARTSKSQNLCVYEIFFSPTHLTFPTINHRLATILAGFGWKDASGSPRILSDETSLYSRPRGIHLVGLVVVARKDTGSKVLGDIRTQG